MLNNYPKDWKIIAEKIKQEANWGCIRCKHRHEVEIGYCLTVHHIDMNKTNCEWWNLVALCQRCHLHIQHKVQINQPFMFEHSEWFKPYVAGYYANMYLHPTNKIYVMENLEKLLEYGKPQI